MFWLLLALLVGLIASFAPAWFILAGTLAVALALLILREPLVGLGLALIFGPWGAVESLFTGQSIVDSGQVLFAATLGAFMARSLARKRVWIPAWPQLLALALFVSAGLASLFNAPSGSAGLAELLKWIEIGLLMIVTVDLAEQSHALRSLSARSRINIVAAIILLAGLSQAILGFWQFAIWGVGIEHFHISGRFYRAFGSYVQPNPYGGFVGVNALLAMGMLAGWLWHKPFLGWLGNRRAMIWVGFLVEAVLFLSLGLIASWSRGAWLGFAAGLAVMIVALLDRYWWLAVTGIIIGSFAFALAWSQGWLPAVLTDRLATGFAGFQLQEDVRIQTITPANYAVLERLAHWQAALDMARDHPWLGVGFGNYEAAYPEYRLLHWPHALGHAHNYYLNLIAEVGIAGIITYLTFWLVAFWQVVWLMRSLEWPQRGIAVGLLAAWTALTVHHTVDKLYVNNMYLHFGVMLGLQQLLIREVKRQQALRNLEPWP